MIELHIPAVEELWFKEKILADEQTMSYNYAYGGTIPFPKEKWEKWHDRWIVNHENKRFYRYIKENNTFLGELACHFDEERDMYFVDVIVYAPYRKKGYGCQALLMLCEIASDNPSIKMFLKCGFTEVSRTGEYVLVRKDFLSSK